MTLIQNSPMADLVSKELMLSDQAYENIMVRQVIRANKNQSDTIFVFSDSDQDLYKKIYLLAAFKLAERGFPSFFLFRDQLRDICSVDLVINRHKINSSLSVRIPRVEIVDLVNENDGRLRWEIDIPKKKAICEGLNFFPAILNSFRSLHKRYTIDFSDPETLNYTKKMISSLGVLFSKFRLLHQFALQARKKVRFIGFENSYMPNAALFMMCNHFCMARETEYIDLTKGYMHYFPGYHSGDSYVATVNCTRTGRYTRLETSRAELVQAFRDGPPLEEMKTEIDQRLSFSRFTSPDVPERRDILELAESYIRRGRKVYIMFTHMFFDTQLFDFTPTFSDMIDWIRKTISYFKGRDDLLLLRPHPQEENLIHDFLRPNEKLSSVIDPDELPPNIRLLGAGLFQAYEAYRFTNVGLIWCSTVGLELTCLGIPAVIAGPAPYRDLDFYLVESLDHYYELIEKAPDLPVTEDMRTQAYQYLYHMKRHKHTHVDCLTHGRLPGLHHWDGPLLEKTLSRRDGPIDGLIDKLLE